MTETHLTPEELLKEASENSMPHVKAGIHFALYAHNCLLLENKTASDYYGFNPNGVVHISIVGCRKAFWHKTSTGLVIVGDVQEPEFNHIRGRTRLGVFYDKLSDRAHEAYMFSLKTIWNKCQSNPDMLRPTSVIGTDL